MEKRREISSFQQEDRESLYDACERYKLLLKGCPWHKFSEIEVTLIFTNGLNNQTRMLLDDFVDGSMKNKTAIEIQELIENMSLNEYRSQGNDRNVVKKKEALKL